MHTQLSTQLKPDVLVCDICIRDVDGHRLPHLAQARCCLIDAWMLILIAQRVYTHAKASQQQTYQLGWGPCTHLNISMCVHYHPQPAHHLPRQTAGKLQLSRSNKALRLLHHARVQRTRHPGVCGVWGGVGG